MKFNGKKFEILRYGQNNIIKDTTNYLHPKGENIEQKCEIRTFGDREYGPDIALITPP